MEGQDQNGWYYSVNRSSVCSQCSHTTHALHTTLWNVLFNDFFLFPHVDSLSLFRSVCEASHSWQVFSSRPVSQKHYTLSVCLDQVLKQDRSGRFWHGSLRFTAHPVKLSLCPECGNSESNQSHGLPWAARCWISASESGVWENKCVFILCFNAKGTIKMEPTTNLGVLKSFIFLLWTILHFTLFYS